VGLFVPGGRLLRCNDRLLTLGQTDAAAAERFLAKALGGANHPHPRVINTDKYAAYPPAIVPAYPPAIVQLKDEGVLEENCQHRPVQYLNNVVEQDHRAIKRRIRTSQLVFLSICETCNYQGLDFLDFLRSGETDIADFADSREKRRF
jgi:IS6 family transposase